MKFERNTVGLGKITNPIELVFHPLKTFLRKAAQRTIEGLNRYVGSYIRTLKIIPKLPSNPSVDGGSAPAALLQRWGRKAHLPV
jgi:hypothetical protein